MKSVSQFLVESLADWHEGSHPLTKNPDGTPKTFYHGTTHDFDEFKSSDHGIFFSEKPHRASEYAHHLVFNGMDGEAGVHVIPVHLNIKNPFIANVKSIRQIAKETGHPDPDKFLANFEDSEINERDTVAKHAKAKGHDGMVISRDLMPIHAGGDWGFMKSIVAFHPHQIKSAIGNNGNFDPKSKKITEELTEAKREDGIYFHFHEPRDENDDGDGFMVQAKDPSKKNVNGNDLVVGHLHVPYDYFRGTKFTAGDVFVHDTHRRRGIATDMYKHMAKHLSSELGRPVTPDQSSQQSHDGKAMWDGFKKKKLFESTLDEATHTLYHGTDAEFKEFDPKKTGSNHPNFVHHGFFFTDDWNEARDYGKNVITAKVTIKNPFTLDHLHKHIPHAISNWQEDEDADGNLANLYDNHSDEIINHAQEHGHDGVLFDHGGQKLAIAFHPKQIKILKEESTPMTRKLTLTAVETEKKQAHLLENLKDKELFEAVQAMADSGFWSDLTEITETYFDQRLSSPFAADRMYIATHGTDAHRDQLVKDEDSMVRFGVARTGQLTHLNQLVADPHPMVRDQVARRGDEELAKKLEKDPHPTVRSSAINRLRELQKKNSDAPIMAAADKISEHFEEGTDVQVASDGRFAKVTRFIEAKDGIYYGVSLPNGGSEVLHESEVRGLEEDWKKVAGHPLMAAASAALLAGSVTTVAGLSAVHVMQHHNAIENMKKQSPEDHAKFEQHRAATEELLNKYKKKPVTEDRENEFTANHALAGDNSVSKPNKPVKLKRADGSLHSEHDTENDAMTAYKNEPNNKGMKIVREAYELDPESVLLEMGGGGGGYDAENETALRIAAKKGNKSVGRQLLDKIKDHGLELTAAGIIAAGAGAVGTALHVSGEYHDAHEAVAAKMEKRDPDAAKEYRDHMNTIFADPKRLGHAIQANSKERMKELAKSHGAEPVDESFELAEEALNENNFFADWQLVHDHLEKAIHSLRTGEPIENAQKHIAAAKQAGQMGALVHTVDAAKGLYTDPSKNECPFCGHNSLHEGTEGPISEEEHRAAMAYHTEKADAATELEHKHMHSRAFMKHKAQCTAN